MPKIIMLPRPEKKVAALAVKEQQSLPPAQKDNTRSQAEVSAFADRLRENPTKSEQIVRERLLSENIAFEFQAVVYGYIPDFYYADRKRIIELDGKQFHDTQADKRRDLFFQARGIKTLRIKSSRVFAQTDWVIEEIMSFVFGTPLKRRSKASKKRARKKQSSDFRTYQEAKGVTLEQLAARLKDDLSFDSMMTSLSK